MTTIRLTLANKVLKTQYMYTLFFSLDKSNNYSAARAAIFEINFFVF